MGIAALVGLLAGIRPLIGLGDTHLARGGSGIAKAVWLEALAIAAELGHPEMEQVQLRLAQ